MKKLVVRRLQDCPPHKDTDRSEEMAEMAYRRGFYQGAAAAIEAMEEGFSLKQMRSWLFPRLYRWRYKRPMTKVIFPEWLARKEKK